MAENKYSTLSVAQLREIVKAQGIKNTSVMRKAQLVQIVTELEEQENARKAEEKAKKEAEAAAEKARKEAKAAAAEKAKKKAEAAAAAEKKPDEEAAGTDKRSGQKRRGRPAKSEKTPREKPALEKASRVRTVREKASSKPSPEKPEPEKEKPETDRPAPERQPAEKANTEKASAEKAPAEKTTAENAPSEEKTFPDTGLVGEGILEILQEGFGFIRSANYLPGENDIYVSPAQIRRFNLKTGDIIKGNLRKKNDREKFNALLYVQTVNGFLPGEAQRRPNFEDMTPIFPNRRIGLETKGAPLSMRIMDLVSPIGRGQRGMIVSPPKAGKTTLLKQAAYAIHTNYPDINIIILLIDERPEEVTDMKEFIEGDNIEVIYSTFDELPEHHKRVAEMVLERAKRLVEHKKDVVILLDSITRLARAYNLTVAPSGRTLTGGLDPAALHMPKKFYGAARNMREGGSLTVLATALVETGSKMDDVVYEEFKGTGNMELVLDRKLSEKRVFPAISLAKSSTRREDLLLKPEELEAMYKIRKALSGLKSDEATEMIVEMFRHTRTNAEFVEMIRRTRSFDKL